MERRKVVDFFKFSPTEMTRTNSIVMNYMPYPEIYGDNRNVKTLKVIYEEMRDILSRFVIVYPDILRVIDEKEIRRFYCLSFDDKEGITRRILESIGYTMVETDYSDFRFYWIELKTKVEKRGRG